MAKYVFFGPDEKHFDSKRANKIKRLVGYLLDYEYFVSDSHTAEIPLVLYIKPATGFSSVVAEGIIEYRELNPDKPLRVKLITEYNSDYEELPAKTQALFDAFGGLLQTESIGLVKDGKKSGGKAVYSGVVKKGVPVFYYEPEMKLDKAYEKELRNAVEDSPLGYINLFDNFNGEDYKGDGVRKRASGITYSYRINTVLPNGKKFTEELSTFVTSSHASMARKKRLVNAMWQDVSDEVDLTLNDVFEEYLATKGDTPSLQTKYRQYFNAHVVGSGLDTNLIGRYAPKDLIIVDNLIRKFSLQYKNDGRSKHSPTYDEDGNYIKKKKIADKHRQGFYAMLSNVFDYAYQQGYISYQPMYLVDIERQ